MTLCYGKSLKADERAEGPVPVFGSSGVVGTHTQALAQGPGIVVGRKGNVGSVYWAKRDFWAIDTVYYVPASESDLYLYYSLQRMHFISTDVAVPGLNRDFAYSRPVVIPPVPLRQRFVELVAPMRVQIGRLEDANRTLQAARDLLLPRLMSGEIEA